MAMRRALTFSCCIHMSLMVAVLLLAFIEPMRKPPKVPKFDVRFVPFGDKNGGRREGGPGGGKTAPTPKPAATPAPAATANTIVAPQATAAPKPPEPAKPAEPKATPAPKKEPIPQKKTTDTKKIIKKTKDKDIVEKITPKPTPEPKKEDPPPDKKAEKAEKAEKPEKTEKTEKPAEPAPKTEATPGASEVAAASPAPAAAAGTPGPVVRLPSEGPPGPATGPGVGPAIGGPAGPGLVMAPLGDPAGMGDNYAMRALFLIEQNFRPSSYRPGVTCVVTFHITKIGAIEKDSVRVTTSSGWPDLDQSALRAVLNTAKLPELYDTFNKPYMEVAVTFAFDRRL